MLEENGVVNAYPLAGGSKLNPACTKTGCAAFELLRWPSPYLAALAPNFGPPSSKSFQLSSDRWAGFIVLLYEHDW